MPFLRARAESSTLYPNPACVDNDPNCDLTRYLVVLVVFLVVIALMMCLCRSFLRLVGNKRNRNPAQSDTDVIYPRDDQHIRAHQNCGFIDPPPRYEQIFKRGGGTPAVITTRQAPSVTRSSGDVGLPPTYEQAASTSRPLSLSSSRELPLAIDMEHPAMPSPTSTIPAMESVISDIQTHAHACAQRYDSSHANEMTRTLSPVELEAPEDGPPGYDAISVHGQ